MNFNVGDVIIARVRFIPYMWISMPNEQFGYHKRAFIVCSTEKC